MSTAIVRIFVLGNKNRVLPPIENHNNSNIIICWCEYACVYICVRACVFVRVCVCVCMYVCASGLVSASDCVFGGGEG